jgi:hypothetical protein
MDQKFLGLAIMIIIGSDLAAVAVLIKRGEAKPGVVAIILILPFVFIFGIQLQENGMPQGASNISGELVIGVIASLIAGIILLGLRKK